MIRTTIPAVRDDGRLITTQLADAINEHLAFDANGGRLVPFDLDLTDLLAADLRSQRRFERRLVELGHTRGQWAREGRAIRWRVENIEARFPRRFLTRLVLATIHLVELPQHDPRCKACGSDARPLRAGRLCWACTHEMRSFG